MAKVTLDLSDDDLKNVSYGQAAKGSLRLYVYGLAGMWIAAMPSLIFQAWLWSLLLVFYMVAFIAYWILRVERQSHMILEDLYGDIEGKPKVEREPKKNRVGKINVAQAEKDLLEQVQMASEKAEEDDV